MKETQLTYRISKLILLLGVLFLGELVGYSLMGGFTASEFTTLLGMCLPMLLLYLTVVIKFAYENRYLASGQKVRTIFSYISTFIILFLFITMMVVISLKALFNLVQFEHLKLALILIQSGFGIYGGYIVTEVFSKRD